MARAIALVIVSLAVPVVIWLYYTGRLEPKPKRLSPPSAVAGPRTLPPPASGSTGDAGSAIGCGLLLALVILAVGFLVMRDGRRECDFVHVWSASGEQSLGCWECSWGGDERGPYRVEEDDDRLEVWDASGQQLIVRDFARWTCGTRGQPVRR